MGQPEAPDAPLDRDQILELEFEYARDSALQANSDRTQVVNLYLILVGGVGSVMLGVPPLARDQGILLPRAGYAAVLALLCLLGVFAVLKLIKLRQAWHDSVLAKNRIKDFYLVQFPDLEGAFRWRTATIPAPGRIATISFDLALLVACIDSALLAASLLVAGAEATPAVVVGAFAIAAQIALSLRLLSR